MKPRSPAASGWLPGLLLLAAIVTAAPVWWLHALPVALLAKIEPHADHFSLLYLHIFGGSLMLAAGSAALYVGWTRKGFGLHKLIGKIYLAGGALGAGMGLLLSVRDPHRIPGIALSTGTLALAWMVAAAMAYRAVRNRRFEAHRDWMIRSYVLPWSFVGCRMAGRVPSLAGLGDEGGAAVVWLAWVVPLLVCEVALQWSGTSRLPRRIESP